MFEVAAAKTKDSTSKTGVESPSTRLKKNLQKNLSMSLGFGGTLLKPTATLLRVLSWDPGVKDDLKKWAATRGVPADYDDDDLRAKLALKLFEAQKKGTTMDKLYCLGMPLHLLRGPEMQFPPGTLFEQRELVPAAVGNPPRTVRITDSSSGWQCQRNRVLEGGLLHVANIHKDALLPPNQAGGYLSKLAENLLTLDKVSELAEPGLFNVGAGAIVAALASGSARPAYWANSSHAADYTEAKNAKDFYSFMHVATFREYCDFLWDAAKVIWALQ